MDAASLTVRCFRIQAAIACQVKPGDGRELLHVNSILELKIHPVVSA
jgi:hypothetical protein